MSRTAYILTFDREQSFEVDWPALHKKITELDEVTNWWHYISSSYILITTISNASELNKKLLSIFPLNMSYLLIEVNIKNNNGNLVQKAWDWIQKNEKIT